MLIFIKVVIITLFALFSFSVQSYEMKPYVGLDAQMRSMGYVEGFGNNLFKKKSPQGNIYGGLRLNNYLGIEAGYETTPMRTRSSDIGAGERCLGVPAFRPPEKHTTKSKTKGWHFGLVGFFPLAEKLEAIGYVGTIRFKTFHQDMMVANKTGPVNVPYATRTFAARKSVLKLGTGLQYTVNNVGLRFMVGYEKTGRFKNIIPNERIGAKRLSLKDSFLIGIGLSITL